MTKAFNALTEGSGTGVKGDTKKIDTTRNADTRLYELKTRDDRQETYDLLNAPDETAGVLMTDADDRWTDNPGVASPAQAAGVDAHYYARVVDDYYDDVFGRDSLDDDGLKIVSKVHFGTDFCNAFWNGAWMTYGDGAGPACLPLSGGLDVDGHEMTHGVTEFTSGLLYENESGALNESFSDMMGSSMEFFADKHHLDRDAEPDWRIGEDVLEPGHPLHRDPQHGRPGGVRRPEPLLAALHRHRGQRWGAHEQRDRQPRLLPRGERRRERLLHGQRSSTRSCSPRATARCGCGASG